MTSFRRKVSSARAVIKAAQDKETICAQIRLLTDASGRIVRPQRSRMVLLVIILSVAAALLFYFSLVTPATLTAVGAFSGAIIAVSATLQRRRFIEDAVMRGAQLDYGLRDVSHNARALLKAWSMVYPDFSRGDEGQCLESVMSGTWRMDQAATTGFSISCYCFRYVEVTESTKTDSDGNSKTETSRTTYRRYGIVAELPGTVGIGVSAVSRPRLPCRWTTSSIEFNERFKAAATSEMQAARILTPTTVGMVNALAQRFTKLDVFMPDDTACISFDDDNLLKPSDWNRSIDSTDELLARVQRRAELPKFDALIALLLHVGYVVAPMGEARSTSMPESTFPREASL